MRSYFDNTSFWEGHRTQNLSFVAGGNAKWYRYLKRYVCLLNLGREMDK
jgi:hypothetical protein